MRPFVGNPEGEQMKEFIGKTPFRKNGSHRNIW